jgi:hypothetical protein
MPEPAPVMIATLPSSAPMLILRLIVAAVDDDGLSGCKATRLARKENRCTRNLMRLADAAQRGAAGEISNVSGFSHSARAKSVFIRPGAMQFTRTPLGPNSSARLRAICMSAAFEMHRHRSPSIPSTHQSTK